MSIPVQDEFDLNLFNVLDGEVSSSSNTTFEKTVTFKGPIVGLPTFIANAAYSDATAKLATARTISISGDATWSTSFDGTANSTGSLTLATVNPTVGTYGSGVAIPVITVNAKGLVTNVTTTALTLGTAAQYNVGTSGNTIPVLNGTNTWDNTQLFSSHTQHYAGLTVRNGSSIQLNNAGDSVVSSITFDGTTTNFSSGVSVNGTLVANTITGTSFSGNANTATALKTGRSIAATGDISWAVLSFNGTANVTSIATLATVNANTGVFGSSSDLSVPTFTVNAKGLVTAAGSYSLGTSAGYNIGTSGSTIPLLNGSNIWSSSSIYTSTVAIASDGSTQDTAGYAPFGVTRAALTYDAPYINMTRAGQTVWTMGLSPSNKMLFGQSSGIGSTMSRHMTLDGTGLTVANALSATTLAITSTTTFGDYIRFPKGRPIQWNDSNDEIRIDDAPSWLSGYNNVTTFKSFAGPWVFRNSSTAVNSVVIGGDQAFAISGSRSFTVATDTGTTNIKANAGGWAIGHNFTGSSGTVRGGFGAFGSDDVLNYFYIGLYGSEVARFNTSQTYLSAPITFSGAAAQYGPGVSSGFYSDNTNLAMRAPNTPGATHYFQSFAGSTTWATIGSNISLNQPTQVLAAVSIVSTDQSAARLKLNNTSSANNRQFHLVAGVNSETQNGFSIYDSYANASRLVIDNDGVTTFRGPTVNISGQLNTANITSSGVGTFNGYVITPYVRAGSNGALAIIEGDGSTGYVTGYNPSTSSFSPLQIRASTISIVSPTTFTSSVTLNGNLISNIDNNFLSFDAGSNRVGITKKAGYTSMFTHGSGVAFAIARSSAGDIGPSNTFTTEFSIDSSGLALSVPMYANSEVRSPRFTNNGPVGAGFNNARNHFTQYTPGNTSPLTSGWIAAAFGDSTEKRVVIGQGQSAAIIGAHNSDLTAWADLVINPAGGNKVGVGTYSPTAAFQVVNTGSGSQLMIDYASTGDNYYDANNHYFRGASNGATRLAVSSNYTVASTQIRATGWYGSNSSSMTGAGAEIGVSNGQAFLIGYNRDNSTYLNTNVQGLTVSLRSFSAISGSSPSTYALRIGQGADDTFTIGNDGGNVYLQSWGSRTLQINQQGNPIIVSGSTTFNLPVAFNQATSFGGIPSFNTNINTIGGFTPTNGAIRLTPNLHFNSLVDYGVILNWDNGATSSTTRQLRVGNGQSSDAMYVRADGAIWSASYGFLSDYFAARSGGQQIGNLLTQGVNGASVVLSTGTADHGYISYNTNSNGSRAGYIGFGSAGTTTFTLANERGGGFSIIGTGLDVGGNLSVFSGSVIANPSAGFVTNSYNSGGRTRLVGLSNPDSYGLSFFQGSAGYGSEDTFAFHWGNPVAGGTNTVNFAAGRMFLYSSGARDNQIEIVSDSSTDGTWNNRITTRNGNLNKAVFLGIWKNGGTNQPGVFAHNNALNAWADLAVNTSDGTTAGGQVFFGPSNTIRFGGVYLNLDTSANPNTTVRRDGSGDTYCRYGFATHFNMSVGQQNGNAVTPTSIIYCGDDGYLRKGSYQYILSTLNTIGSVWTAENQFRSNYDTANGAGPPLQAFSNNGSGAVMAFHRAGYYAVNMGLDSDNVFRIGGWSASGNRLQMDMNGNLTMAGNVAAYSDIRIKKNIRQITGALGLVKLMRGVWYDHIETNKPNSGVIAQELEEVAPELVNTDASGMKSVTYGNTIGYLIEAIKELDAKLDAANAKIAELMNK